MGYRDDVRTITQESRWTLWYVLPTAIIICAVLAGLFFVLKSAGVVGRTVVEREVFEQSYQRSEALKAQLATDQAALASVENRLASQNLDDATRASLEAQAVALRLRIDITSRR